MSEHVIATDPGGRSGWASARMSPNKFEFTGCGVLREDLMNDWFAEQQNLFDIDGGTGFGKTFDVFVYESWYPRGDKETGSMEWIRGAALMPVQHIGALRWIARTSGAKIVTQHPSDKDTAISVMPKEVLLLDRDSVEQHDKDARMHLWLYFWRNWFDGQVRPKDTLHGV